MRLLPRPSAAVAASLALASCFAAHRGLTARATSAPDLLREPPGVTAAEPSAPELAQALQRKYDAIREFATDFVHTYRGGVLNKQLTERGRLLVKKPGKMRWEYTAPEKKLFVSDGVKIYSYLPDDKQVTVSAQPRDAQTT